MSSKNRTYRNRKIIISITGIQGSGKTWIADNIKHHNVKYYDTDKIINDVYREVKADKPTLFGKSRRSFHIDKLSKTEYINLVFNKSDDIVRQIIDSHTDLSTILVFTGITLKVPKATHKYYIKIPSNELENVYRRTILREYNKVFENRDTITSIIKVSPVDHITVNIDLETSNAILGMPYEHYAAMYKKSLNYYRNAGYEVLEQANVVNKINIISQRQAKDIKTT
jgi:uridine kinase